MKKLLTRRGVARKYVTTGTPDEGWMPWSPPKRKYAAYRAPAGGIVARGTAYKGGEMIPDMTGDFMNPSKKPRRKFNPSKLSLLKKAMKYGRADDNDVEAIASQQTARYDYDPHNPESHHPMYDPNNHSDAILADRLADSSDPREMIVRRDLQYRNGAGYGESIPAHQVGEQFMDNVDSDINEKGQVGSEIHNHLNLQHQYNFPVGNGGLHVMGFGHDKDDRPLAYTVQWRVHTNPPAFYLAAMTPHETHHLLNELGIKHNLPAPRQRFGPDDEPPPDDDGLDYTPTGDPEEDRQGRIAARRRREQMSRRGMLRRYSMNTVDNLLTQLASPEHNETRWGHPERSDFRGIVADALDDADRGNEAALLRTPNRHVLVRDGRVVPGRLTFTTEDGYRLHHTRHNYPSGWVGPQAWTDGDMVFDAGETGYGPVDDYGIPLHGELGEEPDPDYTPPEPTQMTRRRAVGGLRKYSENDRKAFLDQLANNENDHTTRAVFADWLEENEPGVSPQVLDRLRNYQGRMWVGLSPKGRVNAIPRVSKEWLDSEIAKSTWGMPLGNVFHSTSRNSKGRAHSVRFSGKMKTWKTRPGEFRIPWKFGLYDNGEITHRNAHEWLTGDPTAEPEGVEKMTRRRAVGR